MIALALIWLAAFVFAISVTRGRRDPRSERLSLVICAALVGLAFIFHVFA